MKTGGDLDFAQPGHFAETSDITRLLDWTVGGH
jgi:hypothetical protein